MSYRTLALAAAAAAVSLFAAGLACGTQKPNAQAKADRHAIVVDGAPFFPVMLIDQCDAAATAHARTLGINLILNEQCPSTSPRRQLAMLASRQLGVLDISHRGAAGGAKLLGWTFPDEPDNNGWTPEKLARAYPYRRGSSDGLLSFVTTTGRFFREPFRDPKVSPATIGRFARMADVAGFDLYPLNACQQDLTSVYDAQRRFDELAGAMPTFQWIETGPIRPGYCGGFAMSPAELTAEAWLAVVGGARGIGFFTHTWVPEHRQFDVSPSLQHAIRKFTSLASAVKPGLLGTSVPSDANTSAVKVVARSGGGVYVFAVNTLRSNVPVTIHVPQLRDGTVRAFGEKRTLPVRGGRFTDAFAPLGVHVYVQP